MKTKRTGTDEAGGGCQGGRSPWVLPALLAIVLLSLAVVAFRQGDFVMPTASPTAWAPTPRPDGATVRLEIDFENGAKKQLSSLAWREKMTVGEVMQAAREFRPGIDFTQVGEGASGLLTSLDGLASQGAGGRSWILEVDGKLAKVGFCVQKVPAGGRVLWRFSLKE